MSVNQVLNTGELRPIAGTTSFADNPIGSILPFGGSTPPQGWFLCQGQSLLRTEYAELFAVIGTSFGSADSTHFNIPDLRGEFLRGAGTNSHSGQGDGGTVGQHQNATIIPNSGFATNSNNIRVYGYASTNTVTSLATNFDKVLYPSTTGVETTTSSNLNRFTAPNDVASGTVRPTNTSVNFIIKATTIALPSDFEAAVDGKIAALNVASVGGSGKYISAISEADGKISATATDLSTTPTQGSAVPITSGGVYAKFASFDTWTDVTSAAVNLTNVVAASTSIKVYSNGRQCKIVGEYVPTSAQAINDGWISSLTNISIKAGYRPKYETALAGFFAANHHSPIVWYVIPSGAITGYLGTANSVTTSISRIPINGMWYIA